MKKGETHTTDKRIYTGDEKIIEYLYETFFVRASVYAQSIINDENEAKDIVQKTFTKIWSMKLSFDSNTHFKTYLYNAVKNNCINFINSNEHRAVKELEEMEKSAEECIIKTEIEAELVEQINSLPNTKKEIYISRLKGMSLEDIAKKLMISKNTVKTHIRLANKQLKENLKNIYCFFHFKHHP